MKKVILIMIFISANIMIFAQGENSEEGQNNAPTGQTSPSLHTGGMSFNVPIYTIQDPDFTLPISLTYTANGFMPYQELGIVGMNWVLNAGGRITRKIVGDYADDHNSERLDKLRKGFYCPTENDLIDTLLYGSSHSISSNNNYIYYTAPDIFYFSINGLSGWFYISFQGETKVVCNQPVTVDLSEMSVISKLFKKGETLESDKEVRDINSIIKLIDSNGYTYIFGGNSDAHKISGAHNAYKGIGNSIASWEITKIIAPNGRTINFSYLRLARSDLESENKYTDLIYGNEGKTYYEAYKPSYLIDGFERCDTNYVHYNDGSTDTIPRDDTFENNGDYKTFTQYSDVVYNSFLDKITISDNNFELKFNYSILNKSSVKTLSDVRYLSDIELKIENEQIKKCSLIYQINECNVANSSKQYLKQIKTFFDTKYFFEYNFDNYDNTNYNYRNTDHYGYSPKNKYFGTLKSVTTPLGGKTVYTYEPHHYSQMKMLGYEENSTTNKIKQYLFGGQWQNLYNNIRLKKVENFDETGNLVLTKNYFYCKSGYNESPYEQFNNDTILSVVQHAPSTNQSLSSQSVNYLYANSSGMLNVDFAVKIGHSTYGIFARRTVHFPEPLAVAYSKVTEQITYPSGKLIENIYQFSEYDSLPDDINNAVIYKWNSYNNYSSKLSHWSSYYSNSFGILSNSQRRGLLKQKTVKENDVLISVTDYSYQTLSDSSNFYAWVFRDAAYKIYNTPYNPTKITETNYFSSGAITTSTELIYDTKNRLAEKITDGIEGRKYFTKYRYADDIVPVHLWGAANSSNDDIITNFEQNYYGFAGGFQQIQKQSWLGRPVETVSGYIENNTRYYTGGTVSLFKRITELSFIATPHFLPTKPAYYLSHPSQYTPTYTNFAVLSQELVLALDEPITNYQFMKNNGGSIVFDQNYIKVADYEYNDKLRLTKLKPANALETVYVWDAKNLYPISETTGNFTTFFEYKPFIGLNYTKDPRGVFSHTTYDNYNRPYQQYFYKGDKESAKTTYLYHYNNQ